MTELDLVNKLLLEVARANLDKAQSLESQLERDQAYGLAMMAMGTYIERTRPRVFYQRWIDELGRSYSRRIVR